MYLQTDRQYNTPIQDIYKGLWNISEAIEEYHYLIFILSLENLTILYALYYKIEFMPITLTIFAYI